jgi:hypothetical protein
MYSRKILGIASNQIESSLRSMPHKFTSHEFIEAFSAAHSHEYETMIRGYMNKKTDRAHAMQSAHAMLMHTVNDRFSHLASKIKTIPNPKGGEMSSWRTR